MPGVFFIKHVSVSQPLAGSDMTHVITGRVTTCVCDVVSKLCKVDFTYIVWGKKFTKMLSFRIKL